MRSEGNVYNPVPERMPKARDADEFAQIELRLVAYQVWYGRANLHEKGPLYGLVISDFTKASSFRLIRALAATTQFVSLTLTSDTRPKFLENDKAKSRKKCPLCSGVRILFNLANHVHLHTWANAKRSLRSFIAYF